MTDALHPEKKKDTCYTPRNARNPELPLKLNRQKIGKVCAYLIGALVIPILVGLIAYKLKDIEHWEIWDTLIQKEPIDTPVVLSPKLQYDTNGALTARIRIALEAMSIRYRTIDREFPVLPPVVPSDEITMSIIEQGEQLLERHGGDIIVYGSAGTAENQVFIRLFVQSDCGCVHGATPFDLTQKDWESTLKLMIVAVMTTALGVQYQGNEWIDSGKPLSEAMRDWEKKFGTLADLVEDPAFKEQADDLAMISKLNRIKSDGDGRGIQDLRQETRKKIAKELAQCKDDTSQCRVRRELLFLADMEIYDGLINDIPERIEEGLSLALLSGAETMIREAQGSPSVLRRPMQSAFRDWLSMANLILACDDQASMQRYFDLLNSYLSNRKNLVNFRDGDIERMLLPVAFMKQTRVSKKALMEFYQFLSQHRYFGWPQADFWLDPFLHAKRSIRRRLQELEMEQLGQLDNRFMGQQKCPSLAQWMQIKGW